MNHSSLRVSWNNLKLKLNFMEQDILLIKWFRQDCISGYSAVPVSPVISQTESGDQCQWVSVILHLLQREERDESSDWYETCGQQRLILWLSIQSHPLNNGPPPAVNNDILGLCSTLALLKGHFNLIQKPRHSNIKPWEQQCHSVNPAGQWPL